MSTKITLQSSYKSNHNINIRQPGGYWCKTKAFYALFSGLFAFTGQFGTRRKNWSGIKTWSSSESDSNPQSLDRAQSTMSHLQLKPLPIFFHISPYTLPLLALAKLLKSVGCVTHTHTVIANCCYSWPGDRKSV